MKRKKKRVAHKGGEEEKNTPKVIRRG